MLTHSLKTLCTLLVLFTMLHSAVGEEVVVPARDHVAKSPQVVSVDADWSDLVVCHGTGGMQQWDFKVETAGDYYIHTLYASAAARPVRLFLNVREQDGTFMKRVTGGYYADSLAWDACGPFKLVAGENSIRIQADGKDDYVYRAKDFEDIGGVPVPMKSRFELVSKELEVTLRIEQFDVNVDPPPNERLFRIPPPAGVESIYVGDE